MQRNLLVLFALVTSISGCSMGQISVRASLPLIDGGVQAINAETDLRLARGAIPANISLLEGMIVQDPANVQLRVYAAQAYYGFAYGFVEDEDRQRASTFYYRGLLHGVAALQKISKQQDLLNLNSDALIALVGKMNRRQVPVLFWTASCWAKWIDMNRDDPRSISHLPKSAVLMERVLALDEQFYYGGPHLFFGVYYGGRAPMFGGDFARAAEHFARARAITEGKLLLVDLLHAQFLARQQFDQDTFHSKLTAIVTAPQGLLPELGLANQIARVKAKGLLAKEQEWF